MSFNSTNTSATTTQRQPSRLQRRAPASLKISPAAAWNVAIPLLSPLASSPSSEDRICRKTEAKPREESRQEQQHEKPVFKKWQHPAAPFCYEPVPLIRPFVPV
ncbi:uncharacterized protein At4g14450, chloroplastic-like [Carica papaya]|uniref:uncharacterized protein At4g14450, chloroplastic-like n=1 Tax=Carica papaya TaxID=3649 RepID=UPI000B8CD470|nr:uncharacterized protein At4g14450, chloroplastic-like [Carica papaya]